MKNNITLENILDNFNVATVMNVHIIKLVDNANYGRNITSSDFNKASILCLDTLQLSNLSEEGPNKTFKVGLFNIPVIRHGKTVALDIKDGLGKIETLINFFNIKAARNNGQISGLYGKNSFSCEPFAIEGELLLQNIKGQNKKLYLFIPCFMPKGNLQLVGNNGEFGVFDLSGQLFPCKFEGEVFNYKISETSVLSDVPAPTPTPDPTPTPEGGNVGA